MLYGNVKVVGVSFRLLKADIHCVVAYDSEGIDSAYLMNRKFAIHIINTDASYIGCFDGLLVGYSDDN